MWHLAVRGAATNLFVDGFSNRGIASIRRDEDISRIHGSVFTADPDPVLVLDRGDDSFAKQNLVGRDAREENVVEFWTDDRQSIIAVPS